MTKSITIKRFPDIASDPEAMAELVAGLSNTDAVAGGQIYESNRAAFVQGDDETAALHAWDDLRDQAVAEVAPQVAQLLTEAINKRLPWTWEPER